MIGESVGNFVVISELGRGGMGEVFLAEHRDIKNKVAIKILLPHISADRQQVQRFFNEAVAVSKIKHAGIVRIFDSGFHPQTGQAYLVMEFLEGEPLSKRIHRIGRMPLEHLADVARQTASVLEATHAAGITHRDLKPDNIFIVPDAELPSGERVKVLDFGIAKLGDSTTAMTGTAGAMGTPAYMSPEQWRSSGKVDGRADVYSLGCLVFEMATGRPPFVAESIGEACDRHLNSPPPSVREIAPELPPALDDMIVRLLAKVPDQRPTIRDTKQQFATFSGPSPSYSNLNVGRATGGVSAVQATTLGSSAVSMQVKAQVARKRAAWPFIAIGGIVIAGGGIATIAATRGGGSTPTEVAKADDKVAVTPPKPEPKPPEPKPPEPPAITKVHLHLTATPATAELSIDGATVDNPFDGFLPKDGVLHRVEAHAKGAPTQSRLVNFDGDHTVAFDLGKKDTTPAVVGSPPVPVATVKTPVATVKTPVEVKATPLTTTPPQTAPTPPQAAAGSAAPTNPTPDPDPTKKGVYKGTKGTIITDYPPK